MKQLLPLLVLFVVTCNIIPDNPADPQNKDYVKPYLIIESTSVHNGDTVAAAEIFLTITGNLPDRNQYRYRLDSRAWSAWTDIKTIAEIRISLTEADTGNHALKLQTCYNPNGDSTDTAIVFVKVNPVRIITMSDTAIQIASDQPLKMWIKAVGTRPVTYQWFFGGTPKNGTIKDTLTFDSVKIADQGKYWCIASNRWGADTCDTIRLTVTKTNYAPKWKADTLRFVVSEGQSFSRNLADSCTDRNGDLLTYWMKQTPFGGDSLSRDGQCTFAAGFGDSGSYQTTAIASDGVLTDTVLLLTTVRNVNRAPVFLDTLPKASYQINEGNLLAIRFKANDPDGDKLTYFVKQTNLPRKAEVVLTDSTLNWPSTVNDGGAYSVKLSAFDGKDTGFADIDIAVGNVNLPPRIAIAGKTNGQTITVKEQDTVHFTVQVSDPNNGDTSILLQVKNAPYVNVANGSGSYDTASGKFLYIPAYSVSTKQQQASFPNVIFIAHDNAGSLDTFRITISVTDSNRAPSVVLLEPTNNAQAIAKNTVFKWRVSDPDGDSLT